ncbi:MAG: YjbQ family protein [Spirochaetes bacterium]|nr:YjbQ family protein [Spirochaetota bacterium]
MAVYTEYINVSTRGKRDLVDITGNLARVLEKLDVREGIVTVFVPGSTAAVTTIEFEPGLARDIDSFLERLAPYGEKYHHHETWHDDNGSSHIQAAMLGPSLTIPFVKGAMTLGTWQQVVLVDCDTRPRERRLVVQVIC